MKTCPVCGKEYSDTSTLCPLDAAVLERTGDPLLGQTLAAKYRIEKLIKRGGMGAVYEGTHVLIDKTVAVKVLRPALALDDDVVRRFSREAKAASRISHPHAVSVTDFGESENGVVFLVMEYLDGRTLKEIIKSEGPMQLARVVEILRQVAGALDAAHEQGVVHRDLKSDNIMLSKHNGGEWAKVLDFGIAKIQQSDSGDADITAANLVIGTPQYMSPEQCSQSGAIDSRSDIYSLGIILYEMLSAELPFTGDSPTVIMMKQVQDPPPSLQDIRPEIPASVSQIILKALAKQPADRFQTAAELSDALSGSGRAVTVAELVAAAAPVTNVALPMVDDADEATLIRARDETTVVRPREVTPGEPSPPVGMRPWRIMVPAAIVLIAVFALVFLLTRSAGQNQSQANANQPGLVADPNSQPVQPVGTPTGESELNISPKPLSSATPRSPAANANESATGNGSANANARVQSTPATVIGNSNLGEAPTPSPRIRLEPTPPPPRVIPSVKPAAKPTASPNLPNT